MVPIMLMSGKPFFPYLPSKNILKWSLSFRLAAVGLIQDTLYFLEYDLFEAIFKTLALGTISDSEQAP